jgi:cobalt-zinc-cadmium efflux system protein
MVLLAIAGIGINGCAAIQLSRGRTMNEKMVSWHLFEDVAGWIVVLISGTVLVFYPMPYLDPAVSFLFVGVMLWNAIRLFRETIFLFLQASPRAPALAEIEMGILGIDGVLSIHDSHLWSLDGQRHIVTLHVVIRESLKFSEVFSIRGHIRKIISDYGITDTTVEIERENDHCEIER